MSYIEKRIVYEEKRNGTVIIGLLAIFWHIVASISPNILFRIIWFSCTFGITAWLVAKFFINRVNYRLRKTVTEPEK